MPTTRTQYDVSDDDLDELEDGVDDDVKPDIGLLHGQLTKPRHVTLSCKQLHEMIHHGNVDLCPEYQRDVVWPESKMLGLIQSLFLNYYIPPIIFAVDHNEEGEEKRVTIDGKQRCTAIVRFMDGEIPYVPPGTRRKLYYRGTRGRGEPLPNGLKNRFDMTNVVAVEYDHIADETQRDIFQRVQLGVALSAAEKLQAIPGPWGTWIGELLKKYILPEGTLSDAIPWDTKRGKPFQAVASMVLLCHDLTRTSPPTSTEMHKWLERSDGPDAGFKRKMDKVLSLFVTIAIDYFGIALESVKAQKVAPVEIWFAGLLIFIRMSTTPVAQLAKEIGDMRKYVRSLHKDIFSNTTVTRSFFDYLGKLRPYKLGAGEQVAAVEWESEDPENAATVAKKRKREAAEEAADPDYRGAPVARTDKSAVVQSTRSKAQVTTNGGGGSSSTTRPRVSVTPAAPPPRPAMDTPTAPPSNLPATFGQPAHHAPNPYEASYGSAQSQQQRYQNNQPPRYHAPPMNPNPNPNQPYGANAQAMYLQMQQQQRAAAQQYGQYQGSGR
ncbi:hypothetical protein EHS25_001993 [Saitozyma podzolica]|uniref:GmrSD restriction endonucleases N-terminal domain-containing protein n=1 Tax=Saitozyma podzolica TaxID=1890683 RepID=A0A427YER4_9TREE|nr:hypothetical protein EHS25_001993 [Saitozyma podzolica]